jgi:hypothetical protein
MHVSVSVDYNMSLVHGVACDEQTAILVEPDGTATFVSQESGPAHVCYFLTAGTASLFHSTAVR